MLETFNSLTEVSLAFAPFRRTLYSTQRLSNLACFTRKGMRKKLQFLLYLKHKVVWRQLDTNVS